MKIDVFIDIGVDVLFLFLHILHLREWILILQKKREPRINNIFLLLLLFGIELLHVLAEDVLFEFGLIEDPFVSFRLILKIIVLLLYVVFAVTELYCYRKVKKEQTDCGEDPKNKSEKAEK